jgi:6-phosphogluconolactonase
MVPAVGGCGGGIPLVNGGMLPYSPSTVAEALLAVLDDAAMKRNRATLAIPGGRSPGPVLTELGRLCEPFLRQRLHLLWLDERAVPVGHAERNDAATLAAWSQGGPLPAFVHPMPAEDPDLDAAARRYAATLVEATGGGSLDAGLVGLGEDGHLASLFPGHSGLDELSPVFPVCDSPKPPSRRLTLGLTVLHGATRLAVLVLGAARGRIVAQARRGPDRTLPISLLPMARCLWYCDDAAAEVIRENADNLTTQARRP